MVLVRLKIIFFLNENPPELSLMIGEISQLRDNEIQEEIQNSGVLIFMTSCSITQNKKMSKEIC